MAKAVFFSFAVIADQVRKSVGDVSAAASRLGIPTFTENKARGVKGDDSRTRLVKALTTK